LVATDRVQEIFEDSRVLYDDAYDSICDPELTNRRVRETIAYIEDAEVMAGIR
jgi:hypothetical protein